MLTIEVGLNGERLCSAGTEKQSSVHVLISASDWHGTEREQSTADINVSGIRNDRHVTWVDGYSKLQIGDVVTVRVIDLDETDPPQRIELRVDDGETSRVGPVQEGRQCSFCLKSRSEVAAFISITDDRSICSECIVDFIRVLRDDGFDPCIAPHHRAQPNAPLARAASWPGASAPGPRK
jgi:hypothetical protein